MPNGGNESVGFVRGGAPREVLEQEGQTFLGKPAGVPLEDKQKDNRSSVGIPSRDDISQRR